MKYKQLFRRMSVIDLGVILTKDQEASEKAFRYYGLVQRLCPPEKICDINFRERTEVPAYLIGIAREAYDAYNVALKREKKRQETDFDDPRWNK